MKIWIALAETDSGNEMSYFYSAADAERYALEFCIASWDEALGTMPDKWQDAYEMLTADPSYMDWLHMDDLDISGQPTLATVRANLANITRHADNVNIDHVDYRTQAKACAGHALATLDNQEDTR